MIRKGFTLIELLIVVAIIAILAAIAVPNFLEAQTRAKVSRVKNDLRTLATGIEAYTVDHNKVPVDYNVTTSGNDPQIPSMGMTTAAGTSGIPHPGFIDTQGNVHAGLTTPVAYITNAWMRDPFISNGESFNSINTDEQIFSYHWFAPAPLWGRTRANTHGYIARNYIGHYGYWRAGSIGPDRTFYNTRGTKTTIKASRIYDPTNGTVSFGNIWRSQKEGDVKTRPADDITQDNEASDT